MQFGDIPVVNVGKKGLDSAAETHIKALLKEHGVVKLKFLKSAAITAGVFENLVAKKIGRTIVLKRR